MVWSNESQSYRALSQRFLTLTAILFQRIFHEILPDLNLRCSERQNRPLPESVQFSLSKFESIWCADGSTLEALFRKLKSARRGKTRKTSRQDGSGH